MRTSSQRHTSEPTVSERSDWIGQQLRKIYDEAVNEPIPDRLKALLEKLHDDEGKGSKS